MAKPKSIYSCTECGATAPKWQGQCPGCGQWNTLVEAVMEAATPAGRSFASLAGAGGLQTLGKIQPREEPRQPTGIEEFDRVLGGGLVAGGVESAGVQYFVSGFQMSKFVFGNTSAYIIFHALCCALLPTSHEFVTSRSSFVFRRSSPIHTSD